MSDDPIFLTRQGAVAELVLNRPERRNALSEAMWRALPVLLAEAQADDAARVLVVRGAGGSFSAGADISEFEAVYATPERAEAYSDAISAALDALAAFPRPVVAMIEGACVGGGCALALACDLRFAARGARFGVTPAKLGLAYPYNDVRRLLQAVGPGMARDLLFTGRLIEADEALACGLIDRLVESEALEGEVKAFTDQAVRASAASARTAKAMIAMALNGEPESGTTRRMFLDAFSSADFQEGWRAFTAGRAPDFSGQSASPSAQEIPPRR